MKVIKFKLTSGADFALLLSGSNVAIYQSEDCVRIEDGNHGNGGWKLHESYTFNDVVELIKSA